MKYRDFHNVLDRALESQFQGSPVPSNDILDWIALHEPDVVDQLRTAGYLDHDDSNRTKRWSWRTYLAKVLARMSQMGLVRLTGKTGHTPVGYYGPVGLWEPVKNPVLPKTHAFTVRLQEHTMQRLRTIAARRKCSLQEAVEDVLNRGLSALGGNQSTP